MHLAGQTEAATGTFIPLLSNSTVGGGAREYCTDSRAWMAGQLQRSDCIAAIGDLYRDIQQHDSEVYEFLSAGV